MSTFLRWLFLGTTVKPFPNIDDDPDAWYEAMQERWKS